MILGVGIDTVQVSRIRSVMERHGSSFERRVFSLEERKALRGEGKAEQAASFFAVKEAVLKSLGLGIFSHPLRHITFRRPGTQKAFVSFEGDLAREISRRQIRRVHIDAACAGDFAAAVAILEGEEKP